VIINKTSHQQTIKIILANGKKDSINLQPNGRSDLEEGAKIDPDFEKTYAKILIVAPSTKGKAPQSSSVPVGPVERQPAKAPSTPASHVTPTSAGAAADHNTEG
jgi:hypothetical protein